MFVRVRLLSLGWLLMLTLPPATRGAPSLYHVKVRGGVPLAEQLKVALLPTSRVADSGLATISTGTAVNECIQSQSFVHRLTIVVIFK